MREPFNQPETPVSLTVTRSGLKLPPSGALRPNHPSHVTVAGPPGAPVPEKAIFGNLALVLVLLLREGWDSDTSCWMWVLICSLVCRFWLDCNVMCVAGEVLAGNCCLWEGLLVCGSCLTGCRFQVELFDWHS